MPRHGSATADQPSPAAPQPIAVRRSGGPASWPIRRKLIALVAVPMTLVIGLVGVLTYQSFTTWRSAGQASSAADALVAANTLASAADAEQQAAAALGLAAPGALDAYLATQKVTNQAFTAFTSLLNNPPSGGWSATVETLKKTQVTHLAADNGGLAELRGKAKAGKLRPETISQGYDVNMQGVHDITTALATQVADNTPNPDTANGTTVLSAVAAAAGRATEELNLMTFALHQDAANLPKVTQIEEAASGQTALLKLASDRANASQKAAISAIQASDAEMAQLRSNGIDVARNGVGITDKTPASVQVQADKDALEFATKGGKRLAALDNLVGTLATDVQQTTASDVRSALTRLLGLGTLGLLSLGLVSLLVSFLARTVTAPMRRLRSGAVDAATVRLPAAVRHIEREGADGTVTVPPVLPAGMAVSPEIREVAQALDGLTGEAVRLATSQVRLRHALDEAFVSMSRRSQSMVEKQLGIIDELEQTEEDPEQLRNLFRLDHLAARMRRYNDNLLVLAGSVVRTRSTAPVPIADIFRAATSEMEQYERVRLQPLSGANVSGPAAGGLIHLLAELLDNAAMYSPPTSPILLSAAFGPDGGLRLEVVDSGVGIPPAELNELNSRLATPGTIDLQVPSRMGLFVVGRLAQRGGLGVRLAARDGAAGTLAEVMVPASQVLGAPTGPIATVGRGGPAAGQLGAGQLGAGQLGAGQLGGPGQAAPGQLPEQPKRLPVQPGFTTTPLLAQRPSTEVNGNGHGTAATAPGHDGGVATGWPSPPAGPGQASPGNRPAVEAPAAWAGDPSAPPPSEGPPPSTTPPPSAAPSAPVSGLGQAAGGRPGGLPSRRPGAALSGNPLGALASPPPPTPAVGLSGLGVPAGFDPSAPRPPATITPVGRGRTPTAPGAPGAPVPFGMPPTEPQSAPPQSRSDQSRSDQSRSDQSRTDQDHTDQGGSDQRRPEVPWPTGPIPREQSAPRTGALKRLLGGADAPAAKRGTPAVPPPDRSTPGQTAGGVPLPNVPPVIGAPHDRLGAPPPTLPSGLPMRSPGVSGPNVPFGGTIAASSDEVFLPPAAQAAAQAAAWATGEQAAVERSGELPAVPNSGSLSIRSGGTPVRGPGQPGGGPAIGASAATAAAAAARARRAGAPVVPSGLFADQGDAGSTSTTGPVPNPFAKPSVATPAAGSPLGTGPLGTGPAGDTPDTTAFPAPAAAAAAAAAPPTVATPLPTRPTIRGLGPDAGEPSPMELAARLAAQARNRPLDPSSPILEEAGGDKVPTPIYESISAWFSNDAAGLTTGTSSVAPTGTGQGDGPGLAIGGRAPMVIDLRDRPHAGTSRTDTTDGSGRWASLGDQRWQAANARAAATPETAGATGAGLPRRRPGANMLPTASTAAPSPAAPGHRTDAESVRGRLGSYQRGLSSARRARHLPSEPDSDGLFNSPSLGATDAGARPGGLGGNA